MNKFLMISIVCSALFASCYKNKVYTCKCSGSGLPDTEKSVRYSGDKKKNIEKICTDRESELRKKGYEDASCSL